MANPKPTETNGIECNGLQLTPEVLSTCTSRWQEPEVHSTSKDPALPLFQITGNKKRLNPHSLLLFCTKLWNQDCISTGKCH